MEAQGDLLDNIESQVCFLFMEIVSRIIGRQNLNQSCFVELYVVQQKLHIDSGLLI